MGQGLAVLVVVLATLVCHSGKASLGPHSPDAESRLPLGKHAHEMLTTPYTVQPSD